MYEEDGTQIKKDEEGKRKAGGSLPLRKGTINGTEDLLKKPAPEAFPVRVRSSRENSPEPARGLHRV
jgi:hypothetical protein